jgi:hypothetical protein
MLHNPELDGRFSDSAVLGAFELLEPDLGAFAEKHSLFVRKYIHNYPMWGFYFRHPSGGRGSVQLTIARKPGGEFAAAVAGEWHIDDEDKLVRSTYSVPLENLSSAEVALTVGTLEGVLAKLLAAPESARSQISRIMERSKDESGKPVYGEFERSLQIAT